MTHAQFIAKYQNKFVDFDKRYGFQCVDLIRQYVKEVYKLDAYKAIPAGATAKVIFQNFKSNAYFTKVINGKNNIPKKGDILFWGTYPTVTGWAGHTAIFDSGDLYTVISFDQNYPTGSYCKLVKHGSGKIFHGYRGVMGWLSRK